MIQGVLGVRLGELTGSQRFVRLARNPPNAAWLCRSLRAGTTTCDSSQWAERDSNPRRHKPADRTVFLEFRAVKKFEWCRNGVGSG